MSILSQRNVDGNDETLTEFPLGVGTARKSVEWLRTSRVPLARHTVSSDPYANLLRMEADAGRDVIVAQMMLDTGISAENVFSALGLRRSMNVLGKVKVERRSAGRARVLSLRAALRNRTRSRAQARRSSTTWASSTSVRGC